MSATVTHHPDKQHIALTRDGKTTYLSYTNDVRRAITLLKLKGLGLSKEDILNCGSWEGLVKKLEEHLAEKKQWTALLEDRTGPRKMNKTWRP